ncbi:variant surface glycoprotein (VSG), putative [Trypanosoma equiperdum]|uniref:Variant surface glycoprotein (VSG), putative n=1 Tax=Trypanosoma equiperdum TaxID=5694 RepID=A0A1G4I9D2_TRYEQ|nr:variant surface glycoprotein (VSG), putative [Trypanosoma equiperdum]
MGDDDAASQAVSTPCQTARYLKLINDEIKTTYLSDGSAATTAVKAAVACTIAAASADNTATAVAFKALAAIAKADVPQLISATSAHNEQVAATREIIKIQEAVHLTDHDTATKTITLESGSKLCNPLTIGSTDAIHCCNAAAKISYTAQNCSLDSETDDVKRSNIKWETTDSITLAAADTAKPILEATALSKGTVTGTMVGSTHTIGACISSGADFGGGDQSNALLPKVEHKAHSYKKTKIALKSTGNQTACPKISDDSKPHQYKPTALAAAICQLRRTPKPAYTPPHNRPLSTLEADNKLAETLTDISSPDAPLPKDAIERKALVHKFFGATPEIFKQRITDTIDKTKIDIKIRNTPIEKTPFELAGTADGVTVLAYYLGKEAAEKTQLSGSEEKLKQSENTDKTEVSKDGD